MQTGRSASLDAKRHSRRYHAERGSDPSDLIVPTLCVGMQTGRSAFLDAERQSRRYHAERGSDRSDLIVPTLCVGMQTRTLRVPLTQSVSQGATTQSVGAIQVI